MATKYASPTGVATYANANSHTTPMSLANAVAMTAGDVVLFLPGTYTGGTVAQTITSGTSTAPCVWWACDSSGNPLVPDYNADGTLDDSAWPVINYTSNGRLVMGSHTCIGAIRVSSAIANNKALLVGAESTVVSAVLQNTNATNANYGALGVTGSRGMALDCDVELTNSGSLQNGFTSEINGSGSWMDGNRVVGTLANNGTGILVSSSAMLIGNIVQRADFGIQSASTAAGVGNNVLFSTVANADFGMFFPVYVVMHRLIGNTITDCATAAVQTAAGTLMLQNRLRDVTTLTGTNDWLANSQFGHVTTDTGGPETDYVDAASGDYTLISASPAAFAMERNDSMGATAPAVSISITGTSDVTQSPQTTVGSGTLTFSGTSAATQAAHTMSATGTWGYIGDSAVTQAAHTTVASGTMTFTGTSDATQSANVGSATGGQTFTGTSAVTQEAQTMSAIGALGFTGTSAVTQEAHTTVTSGTMTFTGTSAGTQSAIVSAATGGQTFTGTGAVTQSAHTMSASGIYGFIGDSAVTQTAHTTIASGTLTFTGTSAVTQAAGTSAATGGQTFTGTSAVTQEAQTMSATGIWGFAGVAASTQAAHTTIASGTMTFTGTSDVTQAVGTSAATGGQSFTGTSAVNQAANAGDATGVLSFIGSGAGVQSAHTTITGATLLFTGISASTQAPATHEAHETTRTATRPTVSRGYLRRELRSPLRMR